jgi:hypothetical protein
MSPAPLLNPAHLFLAAKVTSAELGLPPTTLTGHLAGLTAGWGRAVKLVMSVPIIRMEKTSATTAFAPARFTTHRAPESNRSARKSNPKNGCQEDPKGRRKKSFQANSRRKLSLKKTEFQTGGFPPLSFRR